MTSSRSSIYASLRTTASSDFLGGASSEVEVVGEKAGVSSGSDWSEGILFTPSGGAEGSEWESARINMTRHPRITKSHSPIFLFMSLPSVVFRLLYLCLDDLRKCKVRQESSGCYNGPVGCFLGGVSSAFLMPVPKWRIILSGFRFWRENREEKGPSGVFSAAAAPHRKRNRHGYGISSLTTRRGAILALGPQIGTPDCGPFLCPDSRLPGSLLYSGERTPEAD